MRNWILLASVVVVLSAVGCTSSVHAAIRDGEEGGPTADSGVIAKDTTGGDGAGTVNLDTNQKTEAPEAAPAVPQQRRGPGRG